MAKFLCKVCGETDAQLFYGSIKTYCKEHWKEHVKKTRCANADHYREYDRARANDPKRVLARNEYSKTDAGKAAANKARKSYEERNPEKVLAARKAYRGSAGSHAESSKTDVTT